MSHSRDVRIVLALLLATACSADDADDLAVDAQAQDATVEAASRPESGGAPDAPVVDATTGGTGGSGTGGNASGGGTGGGAGGATGDAGGPVSADAGPCGPIPECFAALIRLCGAAMGACVQQKTAGAGTICYANGVEVRWLVSHFWVTNPSGDDCYAVNQGPEPGSWTDLDYGFGTIVLTETQVTYTCNGQAPVSFDRRVCPDLRPPMFGDQQCTVLESNATGPPLACRRDAGS
jgi:hypothetical protein